MRRQGRMHVHITGTWVSRRKEKMVKEKTASELGRKANSKTSRARPAERREAGGEWREEKPKL